MKKTIVLIQFGFLALVLLTSGAQPSFGSDFIQIGECFTQSREPQRVLILQSDFEYALQYEADAGGFRFLTQVHKDYLKANNSKLFKLYKKLGSRRNPFTGFQEDLTIVEIRKHSGEGKYHHYSSSLSDTGGREVFEETILLNQCGFKN